MRVDVFWYQIHFPNYVHLVVWTIVDSTNRISQLLVDETIGATRSCDIIVSQLQRTADYHLNAESAC
jgi:hypothetical protein